LYLFLSWLLLPAESFWLQEHAAASLARVRHVSVTGNPGCIQRQAAVRSLPVITPPFSAYCIMNLIVIETNIRVVVKIRPVFVPVTCRPGNSGKNSFHAITRSEKTVCMIAHPGYFRDIRS
jgi:hypothetical protein